MAVDWREVEPHGGEDAAVALFQALRSLAESRNVVVDPGEPANTVRGNLWVLASLRAEIEAAIEVEVANCRMFKLSWTEIGDVLGVSRQAARQRYAHRMVDPDERVC